MKGRTSKAGVEVIKTKIGQIKFRAFIRVNSSVYRGQWYLSKADAIQELDEMKFEGYRPRIVVRVVVKKGANHVAEIHQ